MTSGFYRKTAWNNIRKNYRFFIPRILSETGLLGCYYIVLTLAMDSRLSDVRGGNYIPTFMWIGVSVLSILSAVLIFYINSFLMKQRKQEFGIYNVLGMEKRHIGRVLFHESVLCSLLSVLGGLGLGMLFYKLCSLLICRLLHAEILIGFYFITPKTLTPAALFFVLLDAVAFVFNLISVARMKPVELLHSKATGEKEPKIKWLLLIPGLACLGGGYYLALTTKSPLEALLFFFIAVILVIIGTYFLFVSGSIFVLKVLKFNERYYYHKRHMPAVSGLLYRMKQNAVGLASIAILATGVLVMISTTVSLYSSYRGTLSGSFPQDLYLESYYELEDGTIKYVPSEKLEEIIRTAADRYSLDIQDITSNEYLSVAYLMQGGTLYARNEVDWDYSYNDVSNFIFITEDTYRELTCEELDLHGREIAVCRISSPVSGIFVNLEGTLTIQGDQYPIRQNLVRFPISVQVLATGFNTYGIVVADDNVMSEIFMKQKAGYGDLASEYTRRIAVTFADVEQAAAAGEALHQDVDNMMLEYIGDQGENANIIRVFDSVWDAEDSILGMYGTLLFLGILLGTVCMFGTVLIIYYKQISEGYEDRGRFQIMEKIGMSRAEIKNTIDSQVLLVFFLPLVTAGVHLIFASPMLIRMMKVLSLFSISRYVICALITFAVFAAVYTLIYCGTSRTYYKIVR